MVVAVSVLRLLLKIKHFFGGDGGGNWGQIQVEIKGIFLEGAGGGGSKKKV